MGRQDLPSLLLLPFPPCPASRQSLNAAYRPPLESALSHVKRPDRASKLIIAVPCPVLLGPLLRHKSFSWTDAQSLLAGTYAILSTICAQLSIATEVDAGPGSVDATVLLVDHDRQKTFQPDFRPSIEPNNTVIVDFATFASAYGPWDIVFHVTSETGLQINHLFLKLLEGRQTLLLEQLVAVDGGLTMNVAGFKDSNPPSLTKTYPIVCLGGTFDHLHPGHKLLLTAGAFLLKVPDEDSTESCQFIVGITGDEMLKTKKFAEYMEAWDTRARNVLLFLSRVLELSPLGWKETSSPKISESDSDFSATFREGRVTVHCVKIHDAYGPTIITKDIDVLVVSGETRSGGKAVNAKRSEQGWHDLEVYEVDVLDAGEISDQQTKTENFASKISSTAIREQRARVSAGSNV